VIDKNNPSNNLMDEFLITKTKDLIMIFIIIKMESWLKKMLKVFWAGKRIHRGLKTNKKVVNTTSNCNSQFKVLKKYYRI
jgi:hypothetical protein